MQLKKENRRIYIVGNTYNMKDAIKSIGGHWDADRKQWYVGSSKLADAEKLIGSKTAARAQNVVEEKALGTAKYKGHTYFVLWYGRTKSGDNAFRLAFRDGSKSFWAEASEVQWGKQFRRAVTIRRLLENTPRKDCPVCARNFASGRWAPYSGYGDYDDCPRCGSTYRELS